MQSQRPLRVVAFIATEPSRDLSHLKKALCSVAAQVRPPDELVIVVDFPALDKCDRADARRQAANDRAREIKDLLEPTFGVVAHDSQRFVQVNTRSKNQSGSGCWNCGIMHTLASEIRHAGGFHPATCNTFVAILDDDDEWESSHLRRCAEAVELTDSIQNDSRVDWVVCGIERRTGGDPIRERATVETLNVRNFLRGNPGVQGSNLFVRLPLLLRAGCFDENLPSMTDRDLAIRMLELINGSPSNQVAFVPAYTVIHCAESERPRVSTSLPAKRTGARRFLWKHGWRFSKDDLLAFTRRCEDKFGFSPEAKWCSGRLSGVLDGAAAAATLDYAWPTTADAKVAVQEYVESIAIAPPPPFSRSLAQPLARAVCDAYPQRR